MTYGPHDILGIGFGPANIAVAIALQEAGYAGTPLFLEAQDSVAWHPNMMLNGSDIQNNPARDLITPVNPRSRFTFVNYLHETGRLFEYLNLGLTFPLRRDFANYISWAGRQVSADVRFGEGVHTIERCSLDTGEPGFRVTTDTGQTYFARAIVAAPGRSRRIPDVFKPALGSRVFHLCDYLARIEALESDLRRGKGKVAVVGASQSAVEILLDLDRKFPDAHLVGVLRGFGYRLKDTSPFMEEVFFPEFTDYFHVCTPESRANLYQELRHTNYSAADGDVLGKLYLRRYESQLEGHPDHLQIQRNSEVISCTTTDDAVTLTLRDRYMGDQTRLQCDSVVLATGFLNSGAGEDQELFHPLLAPLADRYCWDPRYGFEVTRDYRLVPNDGSSDEPPLFVNGLCETTHGFGDAGSFSLLSLRAQSIARTLCEYHRASTRQSKGTKIIHNVA